MNELFESPFKNGGIKSEATIQDGDIPGGLDVFIESLDITHSEGVEGSLMGESGAINVPSGDLLELEFEVLNDDSTGDGNEDSCDGGDGTGLRVVVDPLWDSSISRPLCVEDSGLFGGGVTQIYSADITAPTTDSGMSTSFDFWVEGANSGTRVTPVWRQSINVEGEDDGNGDDADNGDDDDNGDVSDGDVTLQITSCGLDPDGEEVEFEIEYVDGGPLIAGIIVEAEVDGQYEGETSVAGQSIGPGETASGSIDIQPPSEPGRYPVRVGIVTGSWDTF